MIENEIGYRGSKSEVSFLISQALLLPLRVPQDALLAVHSGPEEGWISPYGERKTKLNEILVKEQRVDGGYFGLFHVFAKNNSKLRCTLMGFERNYQFRILSKSIINPKIFYRNISYYQPKPNNEQTECTNLAVFGKNLSSTVGIKYTRTQLAMVQLPPYQYIVIIGLILSDAWLKFSNKRSKNALLGFKQSKTKSQYFWFVFNILSNYCSSYPLIVKVVRSDKKTIGLQLETRSMPCITALLSLFYSEGKKVIPQNIYELLTPAALAHVIMGDGSAQRHGLIICTDSYSVQDVVRLMNVFIIKYRLNCTLRYHTRTQPRIYISERSMSLLKTIVGSHMCPSMKYKIKL